jgi:hypothetical protein
MAKSPRYPKKFRMKLEKVAEKRDQRINEAEIAANPVFQTYYQDFLMPGSVHLMHFKIDEGDGKSAVPRMTTLYRLHPPDRVASVDADPPWLPIKTSAS